MHDVFGRERILDAELVEVVADRNFAAPRIPPTRYVEPVQVVDADQCGDAADEAEIELAAPAELLRAEAEGAARSKALVAEAKLQPSDRCPECGALGSLEERDGKLKCIDCDFDVMAQSRLGGLGKK